MLFFLYLFLLILYFHRKFHFLLKMLYIIMCHPNQILLRNYGFYFLLLGSIFFYILILTYMNYEFRLHFYKSLIHNRFDILCYLNLFYYFYCLYLLYYIGYLNLGCWKLNFHYFDFENYFDLIFLYCCYLNFLPSDFRNYYYRHSHHYYYHLNIILFLYLIIMLNYYVIHLY